MKIVECRGSAPSAMEPARSGLLLEGKLTSATHVEGQKIASSAMGEVSSHRTLIRFSLKSIRKELRNVEGEPRKKLSRQTSQQRKPWQTVRLGSATRRTRAQCWTLEGRGTQPYRKTMNQSLKGSALPGVLYRSDLIHGRTDFCRYGNSAGWTYTSRSAVWPSTWLGQVRRLAS